MRLFLSSYRFGTHRDRLLAMVGDRRRAVVIANASDGWPPAARESAVVSDVAPLRALGFEVDELDLRDFVADKLDPAELTGYGLVWVRGGNTFVLRAQLARSGADDALVDMLRADALVYAGYSAGACVLTPSLRGLESLDDPDDVRSACGVEPRWDGLGLVDRAIVPHLGTDPAADELARRYRDEGTAHWALDDDQVVLVDGADPVATELAELRQRG